MNLPGFAAEASLYRSNAHYSLSSCPGYVSGNQVSPQSCGFFKNIFCTTLFGGCMGCMLAWPEIDKILGCFAVCLTGWYLYCEDCLDIIDIPPSDPSCCPPGTVCSCGGHCVGNLLCTGTCLRPGAACPPPPPPPPIGCEVGQKCCERDEQGNCTNCIPHNWGCPRPSRI